MANSNKIISSPVQLANDVAPVVGLPTVNVGLGYSCSNSHGLINPWAKYKSVPLGAPFPDRSGEWWKGTNGQCGFIINTYGTWEALFAGRANDWAYQPDPEYARELDFDGYWHDAPTLHRGCNIPDQAGEKISQDIVLTHGLQTEQHLLELTQDDISYDGVPLSQMYFGVAVYRASNNSFMSYAVADHPGIYQSVNVCLSKVTIETTRPGTNIPTTSTTYVGVGTQVYALPFLCQKFVFGTGSHTITSIVKMIRIPGIQPSLVTIAVAGSSGGGGTTSDPFSLYLYAIWERGKLHITAKVTGSSSQSETGYLRIYRNGTSTLLRYVNDISIGAYGIDFEEDYWYSPSELVAGATLPMAVKVEFGIRAGTYKKSVMAIQPDPDNDRPIEILPIE